MAIENLRQVNEQLKREKDLVRIPVSQACAEMIEFCKNQEDPLINRPKKKANPFTKQSSCLPFPCIWKNMSFIWNSMENKSSTVWKFDKFL